MDDEDQDDIIKKIRKSGFENDSDESNDVDDESIDKENDSEDSNDDFELNELLDLPVKKNNTIFTENLDIVKYIKSKVEELLDSDSTLNTVDDPKIKPGVKPTIKPSPRRERIWQPKPPVPSKPKASK